MNETDSSVMIAERNLVILRNQFRLIADLHDQTAQAYHELAKIIDPDGHQAKDWLHCTEDSCKSARRAVAMIMALSDFN